MSKKFLNVDDEGANPSFDIVFAKYHSSLIFFAWKLLGDQILAEDIVTEVFIKYWVRKNNFSTIIAAKAFLRVSTRNACVNYLRDKQRKMRVEKLGQISADIHDGFVLNRMVEMELISEALLIINSLSEQCRRVFYLGYVKGIDNKTLAKKLNLSTHTIKNLKRRGQELFKIRFKELETLGKIQVKRSSKGR